MKSRMTFLILTILIGSYSQAELGGSPQGVAIKKSSKRIDSQAMAKAASVGYTVHEYVNGLTTVDEYVNSSGVVFAMSWQGLKQVNPEAILGSYYKEFADEKAKTVPRGQRQVEVKTSRAKVGLYGHPGDFRGRACDQSLAPANVTCEDLP